MVSKPDTKPVGFYKDSTKIYVNIDLEAKY